MVEKSTLEKLHDEIEKHHYVIFEATQSLLPDGVIDQAHRPTVYSALRDAQDAAHILGEARNNGTAEHQQYARLDQNIKKAEKAVQEAQQDIHDHTLGILAGVKALAVLATATQPTTFTEAQSPFIDNPFTDYKTGPTL